MEEKIDEKDLAILDVLKEHSEYTVRRIAKKTQLAPTTVHSRIKKLKKLGVIGRFTIEIDKSKLGLKLGAFILISVDLKHLKKMHKTQYDLVDELKKLPQVEAVNIVTGVSDIIARVRVKDMEEFDKILMTKIQLMEGISNTQTMMIMH